MILFLFLFTGCQNIQQHTPTQSKTETTLLPVKKPSWTQNFKSPVSLKSHSSFYSLENPVDAFAARLYLIDQATTSIDVQYYIYKNDLTANEFTYRLLQAANRGVKVRMLIDDLTTTGKDKDIVMLANHPNIEIKLFNPNRFRALFRAAALLLDIGRLGKRMHNKTFTVDGYAAILGGRNIGDEYFAANMNEVVFLDYDILALGKVVPEVYKEFDIYWNSPLSVDYRKVINETINHSDYEKSMVHIDALHQAFLKTPLAHHIQKCTFHKEAKRGDIPLYASREASLYFDLPRKVVSDPNDSRTHLSSSIKGALDGVNHELILISPYFIPSPQMMQNLKKIRARNIPITVITNSMASTDVPMVYSGYQNYIRPLLEMGITLYELKPYLDQIPKNRKEAKKFEHISLHTKMIIVDDKQLLVGSANMDPRSDKLNTEVLMLIKGSALISHLKHELKPVLTTDYFYRLRLLATKKGSAKKHIVWESREKGKKKYYIKAPKAGVGKRIGVGLFSLLPIEGYL